MINNHFKIVGIITLAGGYFIKALSNKSKEFTLAIQSIFNKTY